MHGMEIAGAVASGQADVSHFREFQSQINVKKVVIFLNLVHQLFYHSAYGQS